MSTTLESTTLLAPFVPEKGGGWSRRHAAHLMRRAQFGASGAEIDQALADGLERTVQRLVSPQPESPEFQNTDRVLRTAAADSGNIADLKAWWLFRMLRTANPLAEKMTLLWHNHFATSNDKVQSIAQMSAQNDLLRRCALGSFRELLHAMARDVAMLVWLDGNANRKREANENFAREVMELFSLGVGNYTEADIKEAARAFTGWHVREGQYWFNTRQHDDGEKQLFGRRGRFEGDEVLDLCLEQPSCPRFLAGKLLACFVSDAPPREAVEALGDRIRVHDFAMQPVLRELLSSRLFFSDENQGAIIKSPLDFVLGSHRALGSRPNLQTTARVLAELGQDVFQPATVKGWEGGRLWVNSATLLERNNFVAELTSGGRYGAIADPPEEIDSGLPASVVQHYTDLLLATEVDRAALARLAEYYRQSFGDTRTRARGLVHLVLTMPEAQLM